MRHWVTIIVLTFFIPSQIFWIRQVRALGVKLFPRGALRRWLGGLAAAVYLILFLYFASSLLGVHRFPESTRLTLRAALLQAPFNWWMFSSVWGFLAIAAFYLLDRFARAAHAAYTKLTLPSHSDRRPLVSPERRRFLERTAVALSATPFAACAYGMLYERTAVETVHQRIKLRRLPRAFDGFRIAQLSDLHIGPFTTSEEIRKCVAIANQMKPDMVALTGDFVTWDATTQAAAVAALRGLKAPFGIFGSLGNHELWCGIQNSITRLFAAEGVKILRQERAAIESGGERLNLIGVDYQTHTRFGPRGEGIVPQYLEGVAPLVLPDTTNILLSHNPNTFDRAAELGIDLSLAGHTHGGQVTLEFISPQLSPSRLITSYVRGWFQKGASQLYVNRGIGTIFVPIRFDSPPEITLFELQRG
jgi:hypothetical protein